MDLPLQVYETNSCSKVHLVLCLPTYCGQQTVSCVFLRRKMASLFDFGPSLDLSMSGQHNRPIDGSAGTNCRRNTVKPFVMVCLQVGKSGAGKGTMGWMECGAGGADECYVEIQVQVDTFWLLGFTVGQGGYLSTCVKESSSS